MPSSTCQSVLRHLAACKSRMPSCAGERNNDRLALLGDRVLDLIVLQQGMAHRPAADNLGAAACT